MKTHAEVIQAAGGAIAVSAALSLSHWTVRNWMKPGRGIPVAYWRDVCRLPALKERKLTPLRLFDMSNVYNRK